MMRLGKSILAAYGTLVHTVVTIDSLSVGNLEAFQQQPTTGPGMVEMALWVLKWILDDTEHQRNKGDLGGKKSPIS